MRPRAPAFLLSLQAWSRVGAKDEGSVFETKQAGGDYVDKSLAPPRPLKLEITL